MKKLFYFKTKYVIILTYMIKTKMGKGDLIWQR